MIRPQPKPVRERDEAYLAWIRTKPCLCAGEPFMACAGPVEAHHLRIGVPSGVGTKPSDRRTVPLCRKHHRKYHAQGYAKFVVERALNPLRDIERLNREYDAMYNSLYTKPKRKKRMRAMLHIMHCDGCTLAHELPWNKVTLLVKPASVGLTFRCINTNQVIEVQ